MMHNGRRGLTRSQLKTVALRHATMGGGFLATYASVVSMHPAADITLPDLFFRLMCHDCELYKSEVATKTLNPVWAAVELHSDEPSHQHASKFMADDDSNFDIVVYRLINAATSSPGPFFHAKNHISVEDGIDEENEDVEEYVEDEYDQHESGIRMSSHSRDNGDGDDGSIHSESSVGDNESFFEEEVFRFHVALDELEPLQCDFRELFYLPLNTLVLEFASTYYVRRDVMSMLVQNDVIKARRAPRGDFAALPSSMPPQSEFHFDTAADLLDTTIALHRQIHAAQADVMLKRQLIEERLAQEAEQVAKENARLELQARILTLRKQALQKQQSLDQVRSVLKVEKHMLAADQRLPRTLAQLSHLEAKETEITSGILYRRMDVLRVAHSIRALQATLVVQLYDIYPIAYLGAGEYSIGGIKFNNADATNGKDEELLSTALGYIAHFVFLLAKYLNVNLRYAIVHLSSRSYMRDDVNDPNGEYPLYKRGVDKDRFDKAFLFLRKDVEQMLLARGLELVQNTQLLMRLTTLVESELEWVKNNS